MPKKVDGLVGSMESITASFTSFKVVTIVSVVAALLCALGCVAYTFVKVAEFQSKIYVLDGGAAFSATSQDASLSRQDEINDHVTRFHELFFNIPPDITMVNRNLERALALADRSAYQYFENLKESGYYKRMTSAEAYQQIEIKEIQVDVSSYPYRVRVTANQWVTRKSNMSLYTLVTECTLENIPRSPANLHGLMIKNFNVTENNLVETRNR
ncbi:MAG: conjugative transposon protein TraK [Bacteroidales bacterium]|nr:conjugative transposon protein TraK [Bacteroidales bacterium]